MLGQERSRKKKREIPGKKEKKKRYSKKGALARTGKKHPLIRDLVQECGKKRRGGKTSGKKRLPRNRVGGDWGTHRPNWTEKQKNRKREILRKGKEKLKKGSQRNSLPKKDHHHQEPGGRGQ